MYTMADRSLRAQIKFRDALRILSDAGIQSYVVHGNHDPLDGWTGSISMPPRVHVFREKYTVEPFEKNGAVLAHIHGASYPTNKPQKTFAQGIRRHVSDGFHIGLLHCNAGADPRHEAYVPRSFKDLAESGMDYWALGHVHERRVVREAASCIVYPGNTQGRHIGESGPRGCMVVQVADSNTLAMDPEFMCTDAARWSSIVVDIAGLSTEDELLDALEAAQEQLLDQANGRSVLARITLTGRGALYANLRRPRMCAELTEQLRETAADRDPFLWIEKLENATRPDVDLESRRRGQDFLGELLRLIDRYRSEPEKLPDLRQALAPLFTHPRTAKFLKKSPDDAELLAVLDEAEKHCLDLLVEGE